METVGKKLAQRAILRASSGLYFLEDIIRSRGDQTDIAYSRFWYILLSFNFELILNSLIAFESKGLNNEEVVKDIISVRPSHDFEKLSNKISKELFAKVGFISVKKKSIGGFIEYEVLTKDGGIIYVQDLIDVRYDFKKDDLRKLYSKEIPRIKKEIKHLMSIIDAIKQIIF